jgi:hypothetical protein
MCSLRLSGGLLGAANRSEARRLSRRQEYGFLTSPRCVSCLHHSKIHSPRFASDVGFWCTADTWPGNLRCLFGHQRIGPQGACCAQGSLHPDRVTPLGCDTPLMWGASVLMKVGSMIVHVYSAHFDWTLGLLARVQPVARSAQDLGQALLKVKIRRILVFPAGREWQGHENTLNPRPRRRESKLGAPVVHEIELGIPSTRVSITHRLHILHRHTHTHTHTITHTHHTPSHTITHHHTPSHTHTHTPSHTSPCAAAASASPRR